MPSEAANALPANGSSFAKLFASFAGSKGADPRAGSWIDDIPPEEIATITYEQALRAHARYRPSDPLPLSSEDAGPEYPKPPRPARSAEVGDGHASVAARRKLASITIRMSRNECAQLRERAAAAGMTISAYLRSCVFEVETLRAQVKEALSELHSGSAGAGAKSDGLSRVPTPSRDWRRRLFAPWSRHRNQTDA